MNWVNVESATDLTAIIIFDILESYNIEKYITWVFKSP